MEDKNGFLKGLMVFAAGAVVGSVAAVLFTPKSGKETREKIKDLTGDTKEKIEDFIKKGEELFSGKR